jgi:hypothetical protein
MDKGLRIYNKKESETPYYQASVVSILLTSLQNYGQKRIEEGTLKAVLH